MIVQRGLPFCPKKGSLGALSLLVTRVGLEPTRLRASDLKSDVASITPPGLVDYRGWRLLHQDGAAALEELDGTVMSFSVC